MTIKSIFLMVVLDFLWINIFFVYICTRIDDFILPQITQIGTDSSSLRFYNKEIYTDLRPMVLFQCLRIAKKRVGILVNFNTDNINAGIFRKVNGYE